MLENDPRKTSSDDCTFCGAVGIACYQKKDARGEYRDCCYACTKDAVKPQKGANREPIRLPRNGGSGLLFS